MKILLSVFALVLVSIESVRGNGAPLCYDDHPDPNIVFCRSTPFDPWFEVGCADGCCLGVCSEDGSGCAITDGVCDPDIRSCPFWHVLIKDYPNQCCPFCYLPSCEEYEDLMQDGCTPHPFHPCKVLVLTPSSTKLNCGPEEQGSDDCCQKAVCDKNSKTGFTIIHHEPCKEIDCDSDDCVEAKGPLECCASCHKPGCDSSPGNTCKHRCGTNSVDGSCWCDSICYILGDCCCDVDCQCGCPPTPGSTCEGSCGGKSPDGTCYCDCLCTFFKDCCCDYNDYCGAFCGVDANNDAEAIAAAEADGRGGRPSAA